MASIVTVSGRRIHYDEAGSGPPLLMISGLGGGRSTWHDAMERLSADFRTLAHDNRDTGESDPETSPYSIADMAGDAVAFLQALGIQHAHVMGLSMGGFIAQYIALDHPEVVDRLVLVGTSPAAGQALNNPLPPPDPAEWIADPVERARQRLPQTVAPGYFDTRPGELERMAQQARGNRVTVEGYARQTAAISDTHDTRARLHEITAPTLVVHGTLDPLIQLRGGELLAEGIPNARLVAMPGVGHLPPREVTDQFCRVVREFLIE
jgi:pimeloyl-ACP methyl ester carboxylesterase